MFCKYSVLFLLILKLNSSEGNYEGESFPAKYLQPEDVVPEYSDVFYYLQGLNKIVGNVEMYANETDINRALGVFFMKAILKRTIHEKKNKIQTEQQKLINNVLLKADNIMSHFNYDIRTKSWDDGLKRVSELFKDEDLQVEGISNFNRNRLQKWLLSHLKLNNFVQDMDEIKLPKHEYLKYTEETMKSEEYTLNIEDSDYCLSEVIYNPKPLDTKTLRPCVTDEFCSKIVYYRAPSVAYTLSHRMLNVMIPRHLRRCYMRSPEEDDELVDILCSSMYRETVYIARRGYFNRDMWMEHIALCAFYGYEEFHRRHWFRKVMSWIDKQGCIAENFNYDTNRTAYHLSKENNSQQQKRIRNRQMKLRTNSCHWHQMSVGMVVLAHGVRHAVHFSEMDTGKLKDEL